jgi:hypothetical protein
VRIRSNSYNLSLRARELVMSLSYSSLLKRIRALADLRLCLCARVPSFITKVRSMLRCAHIRDCSLEESGSTNESATQITHSRYNSRHPVAAVPRGRDIPSHPAPTYAPTMKVHSRSRIYRSSDQQRKKLWRIRTPTKM